jgi:hypothetical protein
MKRDKRRREKLSQVDNDHRKRTTELARELIFDEGIQPGSKIVARLLDKKSLTPNRVRIQSVLLFICLIPIRMLSQSVLGPTDLISTRSSLSIFCTSSN